MNLGTTTTGVPENYGHAWRTDIADYPISKCPGASPWLTWVERQGSADSTKAMIDQAHGGGSVMTDEPNPHVLSSLMWGFLQFCLSGAARRTFKITAPYKMALTCGEN